jgi:carboxymethylenebutenolidase
MSSVIQLTANDKHRFNAYICTPPGEPQGAIIILHEIFGLTDFIKNIARYWADKGYYTVVPALYDRVEKDIAVPYDQAGYEQALRYKQKALSLTNKEGKSGWSLQLADIEATKEYLKNKIAKPVSIIGFSWGATLGWLSACRLSDIKCVSAYYGTHINQFVAEQPKCPIMLHCGEKDDLFTLPHVKNIQQAHPEVVIHTYNATHGFRCDAWGKGTFDIDQKFDAQASSLADERTIKFLKNS